jgi:hypothetical protein
VLAVDPVEERDKIYHLVVDTMGKKQQHP